MAAQISTRHGMVWRAALMASIACIATEAAAQPPVQPVELSLANAPFVLRDGRTALASVIEVGFASGHVQPDTAGTDQILELLKRVGPTCIRSMQVIGHADEAVGSDGTDNAIQARARADRLAAIIETDGLEPDKIASLWSDHRRGGASGATIWVFVDGMREECARASSAAMAASAAGREPEVAVAVDDGIGPIELIEGQFALPEAEPRAEALASLTPPKLPVPSMAQSLDLRLPAPVTKPAPRPKAVSMGVDDGDAPTRAGPTSGAVQPTVLSFADNSSYLSEQAAKALDRLARDLLAGPACRLELRGTVAADGANPQYTRWLANRRMARIEEGLRSRLPNRPLVFRHELRERDDSRSVLVTPHPTPDCRTTNLAGRQLTAQTSERLPSR